MTSTTSQWDALQARLDKVKKPTTIFRLCEDPEVRERYLAAKQEAAAAEERLAQFPKDGAVDAEALAMVEKQAKSARAELATAQKAYDAATITLRFTALERAELEALQTAHPASEQDEAQGDDYAMDTFAPALISAASLDGMPVDYARHCLDKWAPADARDLWQAAWSIQHTRRTDLGKG